MPRQLLTADTCAAYSDVDSIDMAFRPWETVEASMDRTMKLAEQCKGLIWAVGNHLPANISPEMMDQYIEYFKEIAALVAFLASDEAAYITGANYMIDGGRALGPLR